MRNVDFLKRVDARDFKHKEIFEGITIIHTGMKENINATNIHGDDMGGREILEMYDADGNKFYANCSTKKEAKELIKKLEETGVQAIIGPKAPWRGDNGELISNKSKKQMGIYIVKEKLQETESQKDKVL